MYSKFICVTTIFLGRRYEDARGETLTKYVIFDEIVPFKRFFAPDVFIIHFRVNLINYILGGILFNLLNLLLKTTLLDFYQRE